MEETKLVSPVHMKMKAGSNVMLVRRERFWKVFFSVQAQTPMARMLRPSNWRKRRLWQLHMR